MSSTMKSAPVAELPVVPKNSTTRVWFADHENPVLLVDAPGPAYTMACEESYIGENPTQLPVGDPVFITVIP